MMEFINTVSTYNEDAPVVEVNFIDYPLELAQLQQYITLHRDALYRPTAVPLRQLRDASERIEKKLMAATTVSYDDFLKEAAEHATGRS